LKTENVVWDGVAKSAITVLGLVEHPSCNTMFSSSGISTGFAISCLPDAKLVSSAPEQRGYRFVPEVTIDCAASRFLNPLGTRDDTIRTVFFNLEMRP
jgi:hypothetical protein